jgi:hypothetical protein
MAALLALLALIAASTTSRMRSACESEQLVDAAMRGTTPAPDRSREALARGLPA